MTSQDLAALIRGIAPVVREYVGTALHGLSVRMVALETSVAAPGPQGEKGLDGKPGERGESGENGLQGPQGEPGLPGDRGEQGLTGEKGLDGLFGEQGLQGSQGDRGEPGLPGTKGDLGPSGERGPEGLPGPPGRDGRDGVQGLPGEKALDGKPGIDGTPGRDGMNGRDGTLDNLKFVRTGPRTGSFCFKNGDPVDGGALRFDIPLYHGVYEQGRAYEVGDMVTRGGSVWFALVDHPTEPPGDGSKQWVLCVKHGSPGRPGLDGQKGLDGQEGRPGKDLTQMAPDGSKW